MQSETAVVSGDQSMEELRRELSEAREQQAATRAILGAISNSPTEPGRVFAEIAASAARLCDGYNAGIFQLDGGHLRLVAHHGPISAVGPVGDGTLALTRGLPPARAVLERQTLHVADLQSETTEYPEGSEFARRLGFRAALAVPLMRADEAIGVITIRRADARPFTDQQVELLKSFASQAVIAIENTRLLNELRESLQQQTATADVLKVISRATFDLPKVLDTLVASAATLCDSYDTAILQKDGEVLRIVSHRGHIPSIGPAGTVPMTRGAAVWRAVLDRQTIHLVDVQSETDEYPESSAIARRLGYHTMLAVPLIGAGEAVGAITLRRSEVRPFTDRQIELLQTFADQAVIAIENTRLFEEVQAKTLNLSIALQRQTATSEILGIISASPGQLEPVFNAILERARELCAAKFGHLLLLDGETWRAAALHNLPPAYADFWRSAPRVALSGTLLSRLRETNQPYHVEDLRLSEPYLTRIPLTVATVELAGARTMLGVPLLKDGRVIGAIVLYRTEVRPFDEKQIALLSSFADQALIAIENTKLFEEVQERTRELAKTVEDLEIASQHKSQFVANMSHELRTPLAAILGYAELMQEGFYEPQGAKSLAALTRIRSNGKHLLGLINTVLDIAKIESGQFNLNLSEYALENIVETVRAATEALAEGKKLGLKTEITEQLPVGVGDEQRLTQVLLNLVGNAIKFTDAGEVCITATVSNGLFALSVTDTGPGIPEEHQARIFEQFHQVDSSNTKAKGGTGLGLAIAKQIVEMHGGRIWVESTLGKGATFQMELPILTENGKVMA